MVKTSDIKKQMKVIGADGVHVGTVDNVEGDRIKLTKADSGQGSHQGHHHYLSKGLVAAIEGDTVRLSANGDVAQLFEEEKDFSAADTKSETADDGESGKRLWAWNRFGIGAAALGVAAVGAAAVISRRNASEDDFELRLETDESVRLISSKKVEGTPVVGSNGETLGTIQSFMVDKYTGRVAYAVMSFGGTLGVGGSLFPLPWPLLDYDVEKDGYSLDITKEQLANAPRFEANKEPEFSADYRRELLVFYRPS